MTYYVTLDGDSYPEAREGFSWEVPGDYNIASDLVRKHDDPRGKVALFQAYPDGRRETYTFHDLDRLSGRLAAGLERLGVERGDRVAINVPQKPATLLTHLACWKLGAISVPLSVLFGGSAIEYRLRDSGAKAIVVDESVRDVLDGVRDGCPELETVIEVGGDPSDGTRSFAAIREGEDERSGIADTTPETPAVLLYTSGSTGPPKGVLHPHRVLPAHCPGYCMYMGQGDIEANFVPNGIVYSHAEWAWIGSLFITVLPAWHYGRPVVGYPMGSFDPETAFEVMAEFGVTHPFVAPTALRAMMTVDDPAGRYDLSLETVFSGSEAVTPEIRSWMDETFPDVGLNEVYGQTETGGVVVSDCEAWFEPRQGSMGRPVPGHDVAIVDDGTGEEKPADEVGEIALRRGDDPGIFLEYWNDPEKTEAARLDGWHLTGDLGRRDGDGYYYFASRKDDVINTSGYRVGPGEIEEAILEHDGVEQVGVIGVPVDRRGEIVKAFVQPTSDAGDRERLGAEIRDLVRNDLAEYKYPREIEFVDDIPQTVTGKIQRTKLREREGSG